MAEPEELILEGAHFATRVAREAWRRYGASPDDPTTTLLVVRTRLEIFLTALLGRSITIAPMEPAAPASWLARLARPPSRSRHDGSLHSGTDGRRIYLPAAVPPATCGVDALTIYRLMAVEQAVRLVRGTARVSAEIENGETRDWFLLAEAAAADRWIAHEVRGLVPVVRAARACALARRTGLRASTCDDAIEERIQALLAVDPLAPPVTVDTNGSPDDSFAWARTQTRRGDRPRYRSVSLPWYWGDIVTAPRPLAAVTPHASEEPGSTLPRRRVTEMRRRPAVREATQGEDDDAAGTWVIRADEPQESVEDPFGMRRPADRDDDADPEGLADSLSDLPEARVVCTPGPVREVLRSGDALERTPGETPMAPARRGLVYPEWDHRLRAYRSRGGDRARARAAAGGRRVDRRREGAPRQARTPRACPVRATATLLRQAGSAGGRFGTRHCRMG